MRLRRRGGTVKPVQPWLYALMFIALMMAIAWAVDRHNSRTRRALARWQHGGWGRRT